MGMNCRQTVDALMDYLEFRLPPDLRLTIEGHLAECPRCVEFLSAYRAISQIVRRTTQIELPSVVQARLRASIGIALRDS